MPYIRQTSFLGGEVAPQFYGRNDLPLFANGLRTCSNFFISRQGAAVSRPGTRFVGLARDTSSSPLRLVPYVFSDSLSYVLECSTFGGTGYIRFVSNGARVTAETPSVGGFTQLSAPWVDADLPSIQWAQVGSQLIITSGTGAWAPQLISRTTGGVWSIGAVPTSPEWDLGTSASLLDDGTGIQTNLVRIVTYVKQDGVTAWTGAAVADSIYKPFVTDSTHFAQEWQYLVTVLAVNTVTGQQFESRPFPVTNAYGGGPAGAADADPFAASDLVITAVGSYSPGMAKLVCYPDRPVCIRRSNFLPATPTAVGYKALALNYYKGRGNVFGYVGQCPMSSMDFIDMGVSPDYTLQPPLDGGRATSPFVAGHTGPADYPFAVTYFEGRRVFSGGPLRPGTVLLSGSNNYRDWDFQFIATHGCPLTFDLASRKRERIRSMVGLHQLVILTDTAAWALSGGAQGQPIDYNTVAARVIDEVGSTSLPPLVIDGSVLFSRARGFGVRLISPGQYNGQWNGSDPAAHAQHLFLSPYFPVALGTPIQGWAYAQEPWGIVWAVTNDQRLLSGTPSGGGFAWAHHSSGPSSAAGVPLDSYYDVCVVPENGEDAVYVAMARSTSTYLTIERMESRVATEGLPTPGIGLAQSLVSSLDASVLVTTTGASKTVSGLGHLVGDTVYAVPLGNNSLNYPLASGVVAFGGSVTLNWASNPPNGYQFLVGLPFKATLELLDLTGQDGKLVQKTVTRVGWEVDQTLGVYVGEDTAHLSELVPGGATAVAAGTALQTLPAPSVTPSRLLGTWNNQGRAVLQQSLPIPITVFAVTREVDSGG